MTRRTKTDLAIRLAQAEAALATLRACDVAPVEGPNEAARVIRETIGDRGAEQEHFCVLLLNARARILAAHVTGIGSVAHVDVHPREVFRAAIAANAHSIVVGHCHPSGEVTPSDGDIRLTKRLVECGTLLGIPVLDHMIVSVASPELHYSFASAGLL